jgi:ubiquinone/menaquinone biosynthesis C-methylase UbiE
MDKNKQAVDIFNNRALDYQQKFMSVDLYKESLDFFCNSISRKNAEVIEVACGPGNITKYLLQKRPDFKILGTDLATKMLELAKINNPNAEFQLIDCRNIDTITKKFDAIMCGFCLPYLSMRETEKLIHDFSVLLNHNGIVYVSTMEDDYGKSGFKMGSKGEQMYMHFYREDDLVKLLEQNHFGILNVSRKEYADQHGATVTDLIIIAKNK